ncbi:MAG: alcohol dehydrogenase catalytic domain-containing protein [Nakamurella sp.]
MPLGETMLAVVKVAAGVDGVELRNIPVPHAASGQIRMRVVATGVCGTDLHIATDEYAYEAPVVMGHEICGVVDEVGSGVVGIAVGTAVVAETYFSWCGVCDWCRAGRINLCPSRRSLGSFENGGFAPYIVMPATNAHALPPSSLSTEGEPPAYFALAEPLACVCQCLLDPAVVGAGDLVLVTGPGAMGQLSAQVAKACGGVVTLAGLEQDGERLAVAEGLGISVTTGVPEPDAFDVVIECSGSAPGAATALQSARRGARYVQVGIFGRPVTIPLDAMLYNELRLTSGFASTPASWRRAMTLIATGAVALQPLVTSEVPIRNWREAFEAVQQGSGIKTVIVPR